MSQKVFIAGTLIICLMMLGSCDNSSGGGPPEPIDTTGNPVDTIGNPTDTTGNPVDTTGNPTDTLPPLLVNEIFWGTWWKLIAFVDVENNTSRQPVGSTDDNCCYTLIFYDPLNDFFLPDSPTDIYIAQAYCNYSSGIFEAYNNDSIKFAGGMTFAGCYEWARYDEDYYFGAMFYATSFELKPDELKLYYNYKGKKNYLLFKPAPEKCRSRH